jgi:hypothetical protein
MNLLNSELESEIKSVYRRYSIRRHGSLRLNLTQHGETHQVNLVLQSGPGNVIASIAIRGATLACTGNTYSSSRSCGEPYGRRNAR